MEAHCNITMYYLLLNIPVPAKNISKTSVSEPRLQRYNTILPPRGGFCLHAFLLKLASDNAVSCMLSRQAEAYPRRHIVIFLKNSSVFTVNLKFHVNKPASLSIV